MAGPTGIDWLDQPIGSDAEEPQAPTVPDWLDQPIGYESQSDPQNNTDWLYEPPQGVALPPKQSESTRRRRRETKEEGISRYRNAINAFFGTITKQAGETPEALYRLGESFGNIFDATPDNPYLPDNVRIGHPSERIFQAAKTVNKEIRAGVDKYMPLDPRYKDEFLATALPAAVGSSVQFMLGGGLAGAGAKGFMAIAALGAAVNGQSAWDEAKAAGLSDDEALKAFIPNAIAGLSEAVPLGGMLTKMVTGPESRVWKKVLVDILTETAEETIQESFQQLVSNQVAQELWDENRHWMKDVAANGGVGGASGLLLSLVANAVGAKKIARAVRVENTIDRMMKEAQEAPDLAETIASDLEAADTTEPIAEPIEERPAQVVSQEAIEFINEPAGLLPAPPPVLPGGSVEKGGRLLLSGETHEFGGEQAPQDTLAPELWRSLMVSRCGGR